MPQEINDDEIQSPPNPSPPLESEGLEPLLGYAETRMFLGEMQEAKNAFLKAVRRYPEDWRAHFGMVKFHTNNFTDFTVPELRYSNYLRRARETVPEEESVKLETEYGHYCKKRQGEQTQAQSKEDALKNAGGMTGLKYEIEREEARKAAKVKKVSKRLGIVAAIVAGAAAVIITAVLVILYLTEDLRWQIGEDRANTYTVTYTYTDESGAEKTVTQKFDLRTGVLLGAPVREGYTLAWYTSPECTKEFRYRFTDKPEEIDRKASSEEGKISWLGKKALQLWTRWLGSYTVTFDSNGGSNIPPLLTDEEGVATKPQDPTRNGFVFGGWFLDEELTRPASVDNIFSDTVLYAKWVERCTVTFDTQGGNNVNAVTVDAGGRINQQPNATRGGGYTFAGWYLDPECTDDNFVSFPYTVQKSVTLYAKWVERVQYTITFETNGGTNVNDQNMVVRDPGTQVTLPTISKPGFRFLGWFTDAACNAESRVATNYTIQANATLYAGWEETAQVVVTFVTNGGSNANGNNINNNVRVMEPNQQIGTQPTSGRTGYNFLGWYTDEACTPESKVTFPYTVTASITLYAGWIAQVPVTVTFDPQGGTNANGTNINNNVRNMQAGQIITTEPTSTRPDYNLLGWYTMDECTPESKVNFPYTVLGNITLYAGWIEQVRFTITFETNGGNTIAPRTFEAGNINAGQMPGNPSRGAGFRFAGWYTDEYFDERSRVTFPFALTGDITLYAKWDEQYRLTLNALGVPMTGATTFDRYYDQPVNANQLPTYNTANYTLDGWYFDAEYTEKAEFPLYLTGNATLFAKWIGRYVVTFESNGGSAVNPVTFTEGTELFNWPADPTKYGFLFAGWYTNEALTVLAGSAFVPTGNIKLYAKWMAKTPIDYDPAQAQTFSAGNYFTLMVNPAGGIWAWGENTNGKLGDGTTTARDTPVRIATGINFVVVSAGQNHSMAIDEFGGLWTWGSNGNGRLGLGSAGGADRLTPQPVTALSDKVIVAISAGHEHSLAIDQDGILYAWGNNGSGRLGLGGGTDRNAPQAVTISGGKKATSVSAGQEHSFVIDEDGTLWAFGANGNGRLGVGGDRNTPTEVMAGTKFSMAAAGYQHSAAIDKAGKLYAWGIGGRNGFATGGDRSAPAELTAVAGSPILGVRFVAVSAGQQHTAAIDEFGCLWTWGTNSRGQIGDGLFGQPRATPFEVVIKADAEAPKQQIAAVSAGYRHNLILCADGSFWKCGDWNGQLDNRPNLPSPFILPVPG